MEALVSKKGDFLVYIMIFGVFLTGGLTCMLTLIQKLRTTSLMGNIGIVS